MNNIIKNLARNPETGAPILNEIIDALKKHTSEEKLTDIEKVLEYLKELEQECNKVNSNNSTSKKVWTFNGCAFIDVVSTTSSSSRKKWRSRGCYGFA